MAPNHAVENLVQQGANPSQDFLHQLLRQSFRPLAGPFLVVESAGLMAQDNSLRPGSGSAQRNRKPMFPRELAALRNRARKNQPETIELRDRQHQNQPFSPLFPPSGRVQIEMEDIAPVRDAPLQRTSFPTGGLSSQARSLRRFRISVRRHLARSSERV